MMICVCIFIFATTNHKKKIRASKNKNKNDDTGIKEAGHVKSLVLTVLVLLTLLLAIAGADPGQKSKHKKSNVIFFLVVCLFVCTNMTYARKQNKHTHT